MSKQNGQPGHVETQEEARPGDEHVVTDDAQIPEAATAEADDQQSASADQDAPNDRDSDPDKSQSDGNHKQRHSNSRWQRQQRRLRKAEQRAEAAEQRIKDLEARFDKAEAQATADTPAPKLKDFKTPQEFARAFSKWESDQEAAADATAAATPKADPPPKADTPEGPKADASDIDDFVKRGTSKLGDEFMDAMQEDPADPTPINQVMGEFMFDSDYGPEIYVHLVNNRDDATEIFESKAPQAMKKLEALAKRAAKGELARTDDLDDAGDDDQDDEENLAGRSKQGKKRSKAPAPPEGHREGGNVAAEPDPEGESMDEYYARRQKEELRRRGVVIN